MNKQTPIINQALSSYNNFYKNAPEILLSFAELSKEDINGLFEVKHRIDVLNFTKKIIYKLENNQISKTDAIIRVLHIPEEFDSDSNVTAVTFWNKEFGNKFDKEDYHLLLNTCEDDPLIGSVEHQIDRIIRRYLRTRESLSPIKKLIKEANDE